MKKWIQAARLRTLPLALSSIGMGSCIAWMEGKFSGMIFLLACVTTVTLQVLSNFANDYGDTQNGADLAGRIGPTRAVQSGEITISQMKGAIGIMIFLSLASGISLLYVAFGSFTSPAFLQFLGIGIACIAAAYFYTAGKNPYGYAGLGDLSVFLFFGLVGVAGSYFLYTQRVSLTIGLPAAACGLLATGVLNLNNIRDIESDTRAGKRTLPTRLGLKYAQVYHLLLLSGAMICVFSFYLTLDNHIPLFLLVFPILGWNMRQLYRLPNPDPLLKQLALSTLLLVLLFWLGGIM